MPRPKRRAGMRIVAVDPRLAIIGNFQGVLDLLNTPATELSAALARWGMPQGWNNHALFREMAKQYAEHGTLLVPGSRGEDIAHIQQDLSSYRVTLVTWPDEADAARKNFRLRLLHAALAPADFWIKLFALEQHRVRLGRCARCSHFFLDPQNRKKKYCPSLCGSRERSARHYKKAKRLRR